MDAKARRGIAHRLPSAVVATAWALVVFAPVLLLVAESAARALADPGLLALALPSGRRLGLLVNTVGLSGAVALSVVAVGVLAGSVLWEWDSGPLSRVRWLPLALVPLPPYIHARTHPDKPAYIMAQSGQMVTYKELDDRSNQCARLFRSLGLAPGDCIALCMENHPRFLEICWAAQRSGLYYSAISSRLTASEVGYIVDDCGAKVFISSKAASSISPRGCSPSPTAGRR